MNLVSRTLTGAILLAIGIFLIVLPFFVEEKGVFVSWIYGIIVLLIGLFVLLNKNEDSIERRKDK